MRSQQDKQRPKPLAACIQEMPRRLGEQWILALDGLAKALLDFIQPSPDRSLESWVNGWNAEPGAVALHVRPFASYRLVRRT
jgi:hypothetical protein